MANDPIAPARRPASARATAKADRVIRSPKRERFVTEYLIDLNATQAAVRSGYSAKTATSQGERLLRNVDVQKALSLAMEARKARTEITQDQVLRELAKIGFADIRKAVVWRANVVGMVEGEDGEQRLAVTNQVQLIDSDQLDHATAAAIAEISQSDKGGLKVKFHDKRGALEAMGRHLGMFKDKVEHSGPNGGPIPATIAVVSLDPIEASRQYQKMLNGG